MKVSRALVGSINMLAGLVLIILAVVAALAYFSDSVSLSGFAALAFVTSAIVMVLTYFGMFRWRMAGAYLVATAVLLGAVLYSTYITQPELKTGQYQAVFLTNGQVYFGHLKDANSASPVLTDIYYLQTQAAQPSGAGTTGTSKAQNTQTQLSLVKLGKELHGPEDAMVMKGDQILFWENLKNDSQVVKAIQNNKK